MTKTSANQSAAANRRPAGQSEGSGNLSATVAADRAFPAAVAELDRSALPHHAFGCLVFGLQAGELVADDSGVRE